MSVWIAATSPASGRGGRPWSSPSSSQGITARTPDQFARKSVHNGQNPANTITSHSPKVTTDQGLGSSSRKTNELALKYGIRVLAEHPQFAHDGALVSY